MLLRVVVDTPEEFERWVQEQKQPAASPDSEQNRKAFLSAACIACHAIQGTTARGKSGPDLTHMMSRQTWRPVPFRIIRRVYARGYKIRRSSSPAISCRR